MYHCWAEGYTYSLEEVEQAMGFPVQLGGSAAPNPARSTPAGAVQGTPSPTLVGEAFYDYTYPDGRPSHTHIRRDLSDGSKEMPFRSPDGKTYARPKDYWPIYDERHLAEGQIVIVVEGEKCVDMVNSMEDTYEDLVICALTVGSTVDFQHSIPQLVSRVKELAPSALLLWPDNDSPGISCMRNLRTELDRQHLPNVVIEPMRYNLGAKEDVVDYILEGGSLAKVVSDYWQSFHTASNGHGKAQERLKHLLESTIMISPDHFVFPGSQTPLKVDVSTLEAMWTEVFEQMPTGASIRELRAKLISKGIQHPTDVAFRLFNHNGVLWWRPSAEEDCYQVTADEIVRIPDPPGTMLLVPKVIPRFSSEVDLDGDYKDFWAFCQAFNLDRTQEAILLTWLICAFTGRKTPILLLKGGASTGKTTLATYLCAVVDPDVPTLSAQKVERDLREFVRTAQRHPALLLDNVGTVKPDIEDALSKLVTGEAAPLRVLYADVIETIHLQRAIAVTTTTWDVTKGDLASRMWPVEPHLATLLDEDDVDRKFERMIPKLRGFALKMCQTYYQKAKLYEQSTSSLRIGGRVLQTLGYDVEEVSAYIRTTRARIIAEGEPWLDALVDLWQEIREGGPYHWSPADLCAYLRDQTNDEPSTKMLSNFIRPRQALFPNYGFTINWGRTAAHRFYQFRRSE